MLGRGGKCLLKSFIQGERAMRKYITYFVMAAMVAIMVPLMSTEAAAQKRYTKTFTTNGRTYVRQTNKKPSVYRRHRNLINIGIGTGAGALIVGLVGGKKGALIGALAGGGGSALYTYKLNPKKTRYYKNNRSYNNRNYNARSYRRY